MPIYTIYWNKDKSHAIVQSNGILEHLSASYIDAILAHDIDIVQVEFDESVWGSFPSREKFDRIKFATLTYNM